MPAVTISSFQREVPLCRAVRQRGQCQHAAFAVVVELEHDPHVFERDDEHHRPEQRRQRRQHVRLAGRHAVRPGEGFLEGIQRAGADVAVHDTERGECQCASAGLFFRMSIAHAIPLVPPMEEWGGTLRRIQNLYDFFTPTGFIFTPF